MGFMVVAYYTPCREEIQFTRHSISKFHVSLRKKMLVAVGQCIQLVVFISTTFIQLKSEYIGGPITGKSTKFDSRMTFQLDVTRSTVNSGRSPTRRRYFRERAGHPRYVPSLKLCL